MTMRASSWIWRLAGMASAIVVAAVSGCGSPPAIAPPATDLEVPPEWTAETTAAPVGSPSPGATPAVPTVPATPAAPIEPTGTRASPSTAPERPPIMITAWWHDFGDPRLDDLVERALAANLDLEAAAARLDAAAARARIAASDQLPTLDAGLRASRQKQLYIGLPVPGRSGILSSTATSYGLSLSSSWELDLWGRLRAGKVAAVADRQAAVAAVAGAQLSLAAQTARAWFGACETLEQLRLAERTAASYRRTAEWIGDRYASGLRSSLDLRLALASQATAEAAVSLRRQQLDAAVRQLEVLLGRYPAAELEVVEHLTALPPPLPAGLPAELVLRRPDLVAAERRLVAADARLAAAWRAQFPRLSLTGSTGTASDHLSDLLDPDFSVWNVVGNLVQPLFQGGRLRAGVALARAGAREAVAGFTGDLLDAYAEVETALTAERRLAERVTELERAAEQSSAARRLAEDRYRAGIEPYVTVLEAQRRALTAESQLIGARRRRLDNRVALHAALGGGFTAGATELALHTGAERSESSGELE
jgi:NodT family efflux transporter outer membrane factor (OMF) lipoprotein